MQDVLLKDKTLTIDDKVGTKSGENKENKKKSLDLDKYYDSRNKTEFLSNLSKENQKKLIAFSSYALTSLELTIKEESEKVRLLAPLQYEIWSFDFGLNVGSEMDKIRPCIIVSDNGFNANSKLVTVIPVTTTVNEFTRDTHFIMNKECFNDEKTKVYGIAKAELITTKSKARLGEKIGVLNERGTEHLTKALFAHLFKDRVFLIKALRDYLIKDKELINNIITENEVLIDSIIDEKTALTNLTKNKYSNFKSTKKIKNLNK